RSRSGWRATAGHSWSARRPLDANDRGAGLMSVETIGEAWQLGWQVTARCAFGNRDGMKSVRECICTYDLDMSTLIWTRGKNFPLALLASRLKCPRCGSRSIALLFHTPKEPVIATIEHHPPRN